MKGSLVQNRMSKGQVSIEFILVLIFMLVVVSSIIIPLGTRLQNAMEDVSTAGSSSTGLKRVAAAMSVGLSTSGSSTQFVDFFIPKNSFVTCDPINRDINVSFPIHTVDYNLDGSALIPCKYNPPGSDPAMVCTKEFRVPSSVRTFQCEGLTNTVFVAEAGAVGFSQRFRMDITYNPQPPQPPFVVNFRTG